MNIRIELAQQLTTKDDLYLEEKAQLLYLHFLDDPEVKVDPQG